MKLKKNMNNNDWPTHIITYLSELKLRLITCLLVFLILFFIIFYFHRSVFSLIAWPLLSRLPHDGKMIVTTITAPFLVPIQLSYFGALLIGMPFYLWQAWKFIMPALYGTERKLIWPVLLLSVFLFAVGLAFAYFIFLPLVFSFLITMTPASVQVMTDMTTYFNFVIKFSLSFGICFEVPVLLLLLIQSGIVQLNTLIKLRPYVIISAFVLGMLLMPPDVASQVILALPLWGLFELGIILAKIFFHSSSKGDK